MATRNKRRMTEAEFAACVPFVKNISPDRVNAARAALVDGETLAVIAERYGWTRQAVNICVDALWGALKRYHEAQQASSSAGTLMPPGWQQVTLIAPGWLVEKFRAEVAALTPEFSHQAPPDTEQKKPAAQSRTGRKS